MYRILSTLIGLFLLSLSFENGYSQTDGFLKNGEKTLFPIGFYEHPKDTEQLRRMADSGINMVHCHSREELDQAASLGMQGVVPIPLQDGATDDLKKFVQPLVDHPALAVWEGPDEVVWNFTAYSGLFKEKKIHKEPGEWWKQTDNALSYAQQQANTIIPKMKEAAAMIRDIDPKKRPIWINEAARTDMIYVRDYLKFIDITGCDYYPVKKDERKVYQIGSVTDRWNQIGQGKPVWMVLQAFAWSELGDYYGVKDVAYPTFVESRFMAYEAIIHGAKGILYWGSAYLKSEPFRESLYALTSELSALQPFLTAPVMDYGKVNLIEFDQDENFPVRGVKSWVRQTDGQWLIVLINEDNFPHLSVEMKGLDALNGRTLDLLYSNEQVQIEQATFLTRLKPFEVKVFATDRKWEAKNKEGREYVE